MCTLSSICACRNSPGMSVTITYLPSFASIAHYNIIASSDTVSELTSSFLVYSLCCCQSAQPLTFMVPSRFSFKNIKYLRAILLSSTIMSACCTGVIALFLCNCLSSFEIASLPFFQMLVAPATHSFV